MQTNKKRFVKWDESEVQTLLELWNDDVVISKIAEELGRTEPQVKMWLRRNRENYGLAPRENEFYKRKREAKTSYEDSDFEKLWKGSVPRGHWLITKPWRAQ